MFLVTGTMNQVPRIFLLAFRAQDPEKNSVVEAVLISSHCGAGSYYLCASSRTGHG